jgi:hypothetical protein
LLAVAGVPDSALMSSPLRRVSLGADGGTEGIAEDVEVPKLSRLRSDWAVAPEPEAGPDGKELNMGSLASEEKGGGEVEGRAAALEC